jgi:hypothetical protein
MTEGYINIAQVESDEELETAAVAGAAAVQRLVVWGTESVKGRARYA